MPTADTTEHTRDTGAADADKAMSVATCHCKRMRLTFPKPTGKLNECRCTICRRYGAVWAYPHPQDVRIEGPKTDTYRYGAEQIDFHRCAKCGCMLFHREINNEDAVDMGVNCNMLEKDELRTYERTVDEEGGPEV